MQPHPFLPPVGGVFHQHYRIERCIRAGGMGAIYEAVDLRSSERRALKVLLPALVPDAEMRERFCLEATVTVGMQSEHLIDVFEAGVDDEGGVPFFVMELLEGEDAGDRLKRTGPLSIGETLVVARQVAEGLRVIHDVGVVHRDLKPENLFLTTRKEGDPLIKILDFGVAKVVASSTRSAHTTRSLGTPAYMAPEQIEGDARIDERADLYALGQLVYTLLVGSPYLADEARSGALGKLVRAARERREPASRRAARQGIPLPGGFDGWFARATASAPDRRFASAEEQVSALEAALRQGASPARVGLRGAALVFLLGGVIAALARMVGAHGTTQGPARQEPAGEQQPEGTGGYGQGSAPAQQGGSTPQGPERGGEEAGRRGEEAENTRSPRPGSARALTASARVVSSAPAQGKPARVEAYDPTDIR